MMTVWTYSEQNNTEKNLHFWAKKPLEYPGQPPAAIPSRRPSNRVVCHLDPVAHPQSCNTKTRDGPAVSLNSDKHYKNV